MYSHLLYAAQVLPSSAPRHAVTVWYFSQAELQAEGGQDGGQLGLHRVQPPGSSGLPGSESELQPGQTGAAAMEGTGSDMATEGTDACFTAAASGGPKGDGQNLDTARQIWFMARLRSAFVPLSVLLSVCLAGCLYLSQIQHF